MKKQLLTTTALAAAGAFAISGAAHAQASKPTLSLGGWGEGIVVMSDQDIGGRVGVDVQHDSEIHFKGSATLDNGIRLETRVELEGNVSAGDQIDEAYVTVTGSFGQFRLGSDDNAAHLEVTEYGGTWATQVGQNASLDSNDVATRPTGFDAQTGFRLDVGDGDAEKITYFTPRIGGFRAGFSYLPSSEEDANNSMSPVSAGRHEGIAATGSFEHKFGAVGVGLAAGYLQWSPGPTDTSGEDPKGWNAAAMVDVGSFRFAAGYMRTLNDGDDAKVLELGARFRAGKNSFSAGYIHGEDKGSTAVAGEDDTDIVLLSYRRDLGPGVQYRLNLWWVDYTGENTGSADDNETVALSTSVRVAF